MTARERRRAIIQVLCDRRKETRTNLAFEFGVSLRTIDYDIEKLSLKYPLYTQFGPNGGICVVEEFNLNKKYLKKEQTDFLESLMDRLSLEEKMKMKMILIDLKNGE